MSLNAKHGGNITTETAILIKELEQSGGSAGKVTFICDTLDTDNSRVYISCPFVGEVPGSGTEERVTEMAFDILDEASSSGFDIVDIMNNRVCTWDSGTKTLTYDDGSATLSRLSAEYTLYFVSNDKAVVIKGTDPK